MEEKEKRKGRVNRGCFGWQIVSLSILSTLIIFGWLILFVDVNGPCGCEPPTTTEETREFVPTRNPIELTQISATATAEAEQGQ